MSVPDLRVVSFGTVHGGLPAEIQPDIVVHVADWFRDPHIDLRLREMTGLDREVQRKVFDTPGVRDFVQGLHRLVSPLLNMRVRTVTVAVGCVGGRHRSVVIARELGLKAAAFGWNTEVEHLHVHLPVTRRGASHG